MLRGVRRRVGAGRRLRVNSRSPSAAVRAVWVDVVDRGQGLVGGVVRRLRDRLPASGEAVKHGPDADDVVALGADGLHGLNGRAARGDHVLYDEAALAG